MTVSLSPLATGPTRDERENIANQLRRVFLGQESAADFSPERGSSTARRQSRVIIPGEWSLHAACREQPILLHLLVERYPAHTQELRGTGAAITRFFQGAENIGPLAGFAGLLQ